ncbi:hypothetical protein QE152_g30114 [Popillia japonica]|uniref:Uncharacterized protein n=1 Tax=Popillia japonica TaxID=7064 RepID=A0AAW1JFR9_POPJA
MTTLPLLMAEAIEEVFANLTLTQEDDAPHTAIRVAVPIIVESGETAAVAVRADNCLAGELLLFEGRSFKENGAELLVFEGGMVDPDINEILVCNVGSRAIRLKGGRVLLRCSKNHFGDLAKVSSVLDNSCLDFEQVEMEGVGEADKQALIGILRANSSSFSKGGRIQAVSLKAIWIWD